MLALSCFKGKGSSSGSSLLVWVMREYRVRSSWVPLMGIRIGWFFGYEHAICGVHTDGGVVLSWPKGMCRIACGDALGYDAMVCYPGSKERKMFWSFARSPLVSYEESIVFLE